LEAPVLLLTAPSAYTALSVLTLPASALLRDTLLRDELLLAVLLFLLLLFLCEFPDVLPVRSVDAIFIFSCCQITFNTHFH